MLSRVLSRVPKLRLPFMAGRAAATDSPESLEMLLLDRTKARVGAMNKITYHKNHFLFDISRLLKAKVTPGSEQMGKISETLKNDVPAILKDIDRPELLDDRFEDLETQERLVAETKLRVMFLSNYVSSLRAAIEEKYIPISSIDHRRLIDAILLGTASERIAEHISMYGEKLNQEQLQASLYTLYEPELLCCVELLLRSDGLNKKAAKGLPKYNSTYLLDALDLNTKSRSVFCWSVPGYSGFTPVDDNVLMDTRTLLKGRRMYFEEGEMLAEQFLKDFTNKRKEYYNERRELRSLMVRGVVFFFAVSFADMFVTSL